MKMKDGKCNTQASVKSQVSNTWQSTSRMNKKYSNMLYLQYDNKYHFKFFKAIEITDVSKIRR